MSAIRTPRPHANLIHAWADGHDIQVKTTSGWAVSDLPRFHPDCAYRVKPGPIQYRLFLWIPQLSGNKEQVCLSMCTLKEQQNEPRENWAGFVR